MGTGKTDIFVYAHWQGMSDPQLIGTLSAHQGKGRKSFSFEYDTAWLKSKQSFILDFFRSTSSTKIDESVTATVSSQ